MPYIILIVLSILADQTLKIWVVDTIPLYETIPFLPGFMSLTYIQNTGAAFSFLSGQTGFLTLISLLMSLLLAYLLYTKFFSHPFGRTSMALVLGGAIGNLIDRAFRGFVVDMFHTDFMRFAIFNIADVCVVLGGLGCAIYYAFYYEDIDGEKEDTAEENEDTADTAEAPDTETTDTQAEPTETPSPGERTENEEIS